jgi:hypothetical protein
MQRFSFFILVLLALSWVLPGCVHELIVPEAPDEIPIDNGGPTDSTAVDTLPAIPTDSVDLTGVPCDPDTVYFQNTILPLLNSSCAKSGCHDVQTHKEGVIMSDYANIKKEVNTGNPTQSKVYKVLSASGEDRMPPPPDASFSTAQKNLIKKWIEQGAKNNVCNENYGMGCNTTDVTYVGFISPLFANYCNGCHSGNNPSGNLDLTTFNNVKTSALAGKLYGSIAHEAGYKPMPDGTDKLSDCFIDKVAGWINAGMPQ